MQSEDVAQIGIDLPPPGADTARTLQPSPHENPVTLEKRPRRRRLARRWILLGAMVLGVLWLDGPGLRWLVPLAAQHFLDKAGFQGSFRLEGSLSGGVSVTEVSVHGSGSLAAIAVGRVTPHYQWSHLVRGKLDGLSVEGAHVELRLGESEAKETADAQKPPLDLEKLCQTLRAVRGQIVPLQLDFKQLSLNATRHGRPVFKLEPSRLSHATGSDDITLEIGRITDPGGREYPAQTTHLAWAADRLTLDRLDPVPGLGLSELTIHLPATGQPALESFIHLDDAVLQVQTSAGFAAATLALTSGSVDPQKSAASFGIELPATGRLSAFSLEVAHLMPDPAALTGRVDLCLESLTYQDWQVPQATIGCVLENERATLTLRAQTLGSPFSLDGEIALVRANGKFLPGDAKGTFHLTNIPAVIRQLATRFEAIRPDADVPQAALDGSFNLSINDNNPRAAEIDAALTPADPSLASPLALNARWLPDQPASARLTLDGLKLNAHYDFSDRTYDGTLALDGFSNARIQRWLAVAGVAIDGNLDLTTSWAGGGDLSNNTHRGELTLTRVAWQQAGKAPIAASGIVRYEWPVTVTVSDLKAQTGQQSLTLDELRVSWPQAETRTATATDATSRWWPNQATLRGAKVEAEDQTLTFEAELADGLFQLKEFLWLDGETEIAEGAASLPVPEDFSQWRDTLAKDTRPATVSLQSRKLALALFKPWLPAAAQLDPRATGQVHLSLSGNYAAPAVDATLECLNLRSTANPKVPPAALKLTIKTNDGNILLDGSATIPGYAPALLSASMPFRPAVWAEAPESLRQEPLTARADLPRLDLSRFTPLVSAAKQLSGTLTGNLEVAGKLATPEVRGALHLTNAGIVFTDLKLPAVQSAQADVDLTLNAVTLRNLRASVAGGSLNGNGVLTLTDNKPASLDFRLRGDHLPLLRNDMLILRANLDLRLQGPWETATLTGTAGAVDSLFYRDIELLPIGKPFTAPSAAALPKIDAPKSSGSALPAPLGNWTLDVAARTQEPFLIRGNLATGRVDASVRIGGSLANPLPDGTVTLSNFAATLPFSTLKVKSGTLRFTPESGFDPILEIRGIAQPRPYQIDVYAYGRVSDPQLVLTSNPPLPDNEIMTLLATGTTSSGLQNTQAASSRAIQLFAEEVRRGRVGYVKQLRPLLGLLDRVDFSLAESDPYSSGSLSTATINLSDRWLVSAGMGSEGSTRVMAIWRVSFK